MPNLILLNNYPFSALEPVLEVKEFANIYWAEVAM